VHGVSRNAGNRLVCYCDDCQAYARALGRADDVLDAHGGTEVYQISPARLEITDGLEALACMRLTPRGPLRWYARCCRTPLGNTLSTRQIPYVGLLRACIDASGSSLDEVLGPVKSGVWARYATGDRSAINAYDGVPLSVLFQIAARVVCWRLRGDHRRSPFFDEAGVPIVSPGSAGLR
jgi:hypothetical protein